LGGIRFYNKKLAAVAAAVAVPEPELAGEGANLEEEGLEEEEGRD
jgi:hypothetical protein